MPPARAPKKNVNANLTGWRSEQWSKLGFKAELRTFLAESKMDVTRVSRLIEQGASALTAIRIEAGRDHLGDDPSFDWDRWQALMADTVPF